MTLHVLVWAPAGEDGDLTKPTLWPAVSPWRVLRYVEPLRGVGIELRGLPLVIGEPAEYAAGRDAVKAAAEWADVILWGAAGPDWACRNCEYETQRQIQSGVSKGDQRSQLRIAGAATAKSARNAAMWSVGLTPTSRIGASP